MPLGAAAALAARVRPILSARLDLPASRPLLVAFSGGGDSLMALKLCLDWAGGQRPVVAGIVDHAIHPDSRQWTQNAAAQAEALGAKPLTRRWDAAKPSSGLAAAARDARHRLLLGIAKDCGASVIVLGHTADDIAESVWMRAAGASTTAPQTWGPSPIWPQGGGRFLFRPLLAERRETLRDALRDLGLAWFDDPANAAPQSLRATARRTLEAAPEAEAERTAPPVDLSGWVNAPAPGLFHLPEAALDLAPEALTRLIGVLALSAGAGETQPRRDRLLRLCEGLRIAPAFVATLAGAKILRRADGVWIGAEPGEARRRGADPAPRFWPQPGVAGTPTFAADVRAVLTLPDARRLKSLPPPFRAVVPLIRDGAAARLAIRGADLIDAPFWRAKAALGAFASERDLALNPLLEASC